MARVIHTAQALVDEVLEVAALPRRGGNAVATRDTRYAASAVNILLAAARSGAECVQAGSVGTGPNGDLIRDVLGAAGISVSSPQVPGLDTGTCYVLLEPSAERTFITTQGAERRISVDSLGTSDPRPGDLVCVSGYSFFGETRDPLLTWLEGLPEGVVVVLDPGAAYADLELDLLRRTLALVDVWTSNAEEADDLVARADELGRSEVGDAATGERPLPIAESAVLVSRLLPPTATTVVRDGPEGCVLVVDGESSTFPGFPQTPVDTNGAGDTHTGVLVAELAKGADWPAVLTRANAAGAIKVTRRGPDTAPTGAEITDFLAAQPPSSERR